MGEFFNGWRRKAGLVTLAMSLLLAAAWMRSAVISDYITVATAPETVHVLISDRGRFHWHRMTLARHADGSYHAMTSGWESWNQSPYLDWIPDLEGSPDEAFVWRRLFGGFIFGQSKGFPMDQDRFAVVPYWPLTLLSAWLILAKPQKAKAATGGAP